MKYRVLGAHTSGNFFDIEVEAANGLAAFGAAALMLQDADEDEDAEFFVAIPVGTSYELPGDGVVTLGTVLDPEQADVFGLAGGTQLPDGVEQAARTAELAHRFQELNTSQQQDLARAVGAGKVFGAVREMLHVFVPEETVEVALDAVQLEYDRLAALRSQGVTGS